MLTFAMTACSPRRKMLRAGLQATNRICQCIQIGCGRSQGPHPAKRLKDDIFSNLLDPKKILL